MPFLFRGRPNSRLEQDARAVRAADEAQLAEVAAKRLQAGQQTVSERVASLLGDKQSQNLSLQGLSRLTLHRTPIDMGGVLIEEPEPFSAKPVRINFDIAADGTRLEIATHSALENKRFRFIESPQGAYLEKDESRLLLTSPLAQEGLQRLDAICTYLGSFCLSHAS